jgi:outer membrane protein OmpA-like peptidoglycan-associated protein
MKAIESIRSSFPSQLALVLLASAFAIPTLAQEAQSPAVDQQPTASATALPPANGTNRASEPREGFWGRINPLARKKWVNNQVNPLKGQLNELDEANGKNSRDIQDVDRRAQAGIGHAQSTADAANQAALAAGSQARDASGIARGAAGQVDQLGTTVSGLDQYRQTTELEVAFHGGQPVLSAAARKQLDDFAANLTGHQGYVLEIEGHSPLAGGAGIQNSERLAEAVKRYLVTDHQIPVYRLHSVALGNAAGAEDALPAKANRVRIRLMENSLAAQETTSPHGVASLTGAERP